MPTKLDKELLTQIYQALSAPTPSLLEDESPDVRTKLLALNVSDLDDIIIEMKANEASVVNNGGLEAQLEYLLSELTAEEILEWAGNKA